MEKLLRKLKGGTWYYVSVHTLQEKACFWTQDIKGLQLYNVLETETYG